jgi:hypothetical protein
MGDESVVVVRPANRVAYAWSIEGRYVRFERGDVVHGLLGAVPAFVLVSLGHVAAGCAFAIGLLPTSLMGIAPTRRLRAIYGAVGCLFGVGIFFGSLIFQSHSVLGTSLFFIVVSWGATVLASKRPAGGVLLSILLPSLAVGTGYGVSKAAVLMVAFFAGSIWSSLVMMIKAEFPPDETAAAKLRALQPAHPATYGLLLGLTAATSISVGHLFNIPYPGWIATAAMLIMRPLQDMTGFRGVGRAIATIVGTLAVVGALNLHLSYFWTALLILVVATVTIGARTSRLYITSFGTAFLILTIELYGVHDTAGIRNIGFYRIFNNVLGALIAMFYGLFISVLIERHLFGRVRTET